MTTGELTVFPWSEEKDSRNAFPQSRPLHYVRAGESEISSPTSSLDADDSSALKSHAVLQPQDAIRILTMQVWVYGLAAPQFYSSWFQQKGRGVQPSNKLLFPSLPSLPWTLRRPRSWWSRLQQESTRQFIYSLRESSNIILSS